jgi:hypothetical protein
MTNNQRNKYQNKGKDLICWVCVFLKAGGYLTSQSGVAPYRAGLTLHCSLEWRIKVVNAICPQKWGH